MRIKDQKANSVDLDEMAHYEPPQDLRCLQIQLFSSLAKEYILSLTAPHMKLFSDFGSLVSHLTIFLSP